MKIHLTIIVLLIFSQIVFGQEHPFEIRFSHQIEAELAEGKIRSGRAALLYSFIGDYHNSISYSSSSVWWGVDSLDLVNYSLEDAIPKLVEEAQNHQIVIISEHHYRPQHRIFSKKLISELVKIGFEHLGMEGIGLLDTALNRRGYPLNHPITGVYTLEPKMGDLVRTAIDLDFNLFGYDEMVKSKVKDRDEVQADNIITYLKNHPNAKIILHCGWHHAVESAFPKPQADATFWMAKLLKDKLGIDPLTIYQDNFTEKLTGNEHPYLRDLQIEVPSIFVDQEGENVSLTEHVDIEVVHPKTTYINGRPSWLYEDKHYQSVRVETGRFDIEFPVIVSAHHINEINSVPVDRIELKHRLDHRVLVLKPGEYRISIYDGINTWEYNQVVE